MANIYQIILLGIIQGLTEFLPISSSGHLLIAQKFINFQPNVLLVNSFLHLGTLLAIVILFWKDIWLIVKERNWKLIWILFIASIATAIIGLCLEKIVSNFNLKFVALGFFVTALLLFKTSRIVKENRTGGKEIKDLTFKDALAIGVIQGISVLPGISRSGSTLFAAISRKLKTEIAFNFIFLLAIPAIIGASLLEITKNLFLVMSMRGELVVGLIISCIFGIIGIKMLRYVITRSKLWYFSIYLIVWGIILLFIK